MDRPIKPIQRVQFAAVVFFATISLAKADDTLELKNALRSANGDVARLEADRVYEISEKLELKQLCPNGIRIEGNGATIKASENFRHGVLLTANVLLRDDPYSAGAAIRNLTIDGNGFVGRPVFGNWKKARIDNLTVRGGTVYQINAIWQDSLLTNIHVEGNRDQTNNGFDCNMQNSTLYNVTVDMNGNLKESAFWLNGCKDAKVLNAHIIDGRTAFGLENCQGVDVVNLKARGEFSFRLANILPSAPSERIHLYNVDFETNHVGSDPATGVHFNATIDGFVAGGTIKSTGPGVLLTHGASQISVYRVKLPRESVSPKHEWTRTRTAYCSRAGGKPKNYAPIVFAGPSGIAKAPLDREIVLQGIVADEKANKDLRIRWKKIAGPGKVVFVEPGKQETSARFSKPGNYRLLLTASDGRLESEDEVTLKVVTDRTKPRTRSSAATRRTVAKSR